MKKYFRWLYKEKDYYPPLTRKGYLEQFGLKKQKGKYVVTDRQKLEHAYSKAWENRDYEIDKFWTRAAYFWGFIVLIFGGYVTVLTGERAQPAIEMHLDLYLLLLGFLFSISWYLVIRGSKTWQTNWEMHIDFLEDFVSGPLYKTVFYSGKKFYSVSKLNEVMSIVVLIVWTMLLTQFTITKFKLFANDKLTTAEFYGLLFSLVGTAVFAMVMFVGYASGGYRSDKNRFIGRWDR